jgi:hypothetical protein
MQAENNPVSEVINETVNETLNQPADASNKSSNSAESLANSKSAKVKPAGPVPTNTSAQGVIPEYNGVDRNAWLFGFNPQQELWNGRLAMLGFVAYLLWDLVGYSVVRDALHWVR